MFHLFLSADTCGLHIALLSKEQSLGEKISMATMTKLRSAAEMSKYSQDMQSRQGAYSQVR